MRKSEFLMLKKELKSAPHLNDTLVASDNVGIQHIGVLSIVCRWLRPNMPLVYHGYGVTRSLFFSALGYRHGQDKIICFLRKKLASPNILRGST